MKLSFEEWKQKYISVDPAAVKSLEDYHNVIPQEEIDEILRPMYNEYASEFDV